MKLDRNITNPRRGKYALIKLREVGTLIHKFIVHGSGYHFSVPEQAVDFGDTEDSDFFVMRLKDKYAGAALMAYAREAAKDDKEYAEEVRELALKAMNHKNKKRPT